MNKIVPGGMGQTDSSDLAKFIGYKILSSAGLVTLFGYLGVVIGLFIADGVGFQLLAWFFIYAFVIFSVLQCLLFNNHITDRTSKAWGWPLMGLWAVMLIFNFVQLGVNEVLPVPSDYYAYAAVILSIVAILIVRFFERQ